MKKCFQYNHGLTRFPQTFYLHNTYFAFSYDGWTENFQIVFQFSEALAQGNETNSNVHLKFYLKNSLQ